MFEILTTPSFNAEKLVCGEEYDYVTRTSFNQGILRKTGFVNQANINEKGTWSLGLLQMDFFYRKNPWYAGQFVRKIVPKIALNDNSILYFTTLFNKQKQRLLNVLVRDVDRTFSNAYIQLPTKDGKIDFEFMDACIRELEEERIRELEEERIRELSAYLTVSGLDNYELSSEEKEALDKFDSPLGEKLQDVQWGECRIGDLFEKLNLKFKKSTFNKATDISKTRTSEFNIPLINAKFGDNGIMYYGRKNDFETASMTIDIVNDGAISTASVYPQPQETGVLYNAYLIKPLFDVNNHILYFLSTTIQKSIKEKFGYENKAGWEKVKKEFIQLPTKNGKIDFEFMELLISAVQKLAIKDVVLYADEKIQSTKKIVKES